MFQEAKNFKGHEPPCPYFPRVYGVDNIGVGSDRYMSGSK